MPLTTETRADLLAALQPLVASIAEDLRQRLVSPATAAARAARQAAARLHEDERVGDALDVWLDLLARRAAVLWVLKLIYVRVLEDRALIRPRVGDRTHQQLFERLAPSLGSAAFLRWVYTDLAQPRGGLPELFSPQPAEVLAPTDAHCRELLDLVRSRHLATGALRFDFAGERFDGQLLGDLYQELDPVVKSRYALLQTPSFVRAFMLDRTLGQALLQWPADEIRVLDPACGSGHFLIDALRRLVDATAEQHPDWPRRQVVQHALNRVVGIDLNDYAAALARARLVMTALELSGEGSLAAARSFAPQVFWADGLEQVERGEDTRHASQLSLLEGAQAVPRAVFTPADTRAALRPVLQPGFHVVVANPPYITEKDKARKKYHKEKVGTGRSKQARYGSAHRTYSLGAPFTERCFQLAISGGHVGIINSNSFAKREFGRPLVEDVLAHRDLHLIVDTSGAYIPGCGTPTILLFARNRPPQGDAFTAVLGKRGEPSNPPDPSKGKVWSAIRAGFDQPGFDSDFISTEMVQREWFCQHPWSLRGGGALGLQHRIDSSAVAELSVHIDVVGRTTHTGLDPVYYLPPHLASRVGADDRSVWLVRGEDVRDYEIRRGDIALFPYASSGEPAPPEPQTREARYYWRYRTVLSRRVDFGRSIAERGMHFSEHSMFFADRYKIPFGITFAFVATHNHFVLDRGGKVFNQTAPVIKLPADATEDDHLALLGPLNSSTACMWMKQVFFCKGGQGINEGHKSENWEQFYEHDSTKLARFPLPPNRDATIPWARALDALGHARAADTVAATLADPGWISAEALTAALQARRQRDLGRLRQMVGLQEELDWLCYRLYGITGDDLPVLDPDDTPPLTPGWRPFELTLAAEDADARAAIAAGETPDAPPTAWFERHGWEPCTALPDDADAQTRALTQQRLQAIASSADLRLLEAPVHKRRWYRPDFDKDEAAALDTFLLTRLEDTLKACDAPQHPRALARALSTHPRFVAAAQVRTGSDAPDLEALCASLMAGDSVPAWTRHRYTKKGLVKRRAWERTWALQHREDQGETVKIKVPPKYTGADFLHGHAYKLRGRLDVPKERFVAHTEVPTAAGGRREGADALYAWAGWTREERVDRLFGLLERLDDEGVPKGQRLALSDVIHGYLDELARSEPGTAADLRADLTYDAGDRPTDAQLDAWLRAHPARGAWE